MIIYVFPTIDMTCDPKSWKDIQKKKLIYQEKKNNNGEKDSLCNITTCNGFLDVVDPLSPRSDEHVTSPHNMHTYSKSVMRILKLNG